MTKNDEGRGVYLTGEIKALLVTQLERVESVQKKIGRRARCAHDFRRTTVRNMERRGVPRSVATKLPGHKTETMYRRDAHCERSGPARSQPPARWAHFGHTGPTDG